MLADAGHTFSGHKLQSRNKELDLTDLSPSVEAMQPCQHSTKPGGRVYVLWLHAMLLKGSIEPTIELASPQGRCCATECVQDNRSVV